MADGTGCRAGRRHEYDRDFRGSGMNAGALKRGQRWHQDGKRGIVQHRRRSYRMKQPLASYLDQFIKSVYQSNTFGDNKRNAPSVLGAVQLTVLLKLWV
jgi:hypothetical protein